MIQTAVNRLDPIPMKKMMTVIMMKILIQIAQFYLELNRSNVKGDIVE
jgi:hypothetical protein